MRRLAWTLVAGLLAVSPALAQGGAGEMEALMRRYLDLWNAHDSGAIVTQIYRLPETHPWHTKEGLQGEFDRLMKDGYDHSDTSSIRGCMTGADTGDVELKFVRLKTDGTPMPPKDRVSIYHLKNFPDGWRVTGMQSAAAGTTMACPAAAK